MLQVSFLRPDWVEEGTSQQTDVVRYFQVNECGADASTAKNDGATPVWIAAQNGHSATVWALVQECSADASTAHKNGATPVWKAAQNGHTETVRALERER